VSTNTARPRTIHLPGWRIECERCRDLNATIQHINGKWMCRSCARAHTAEVREENRRMTRLVLELVALAIVALAIRQVIG
jgi:hypothetical protein